jgi:hypothetical protein
MRIVFNLRVGRSIIDRRVGMGRERLRNET